MSCQAITQITEPDQNTYQLALPVREIQHFPYGMTFRIQRIPNVFTCKTRDHQSFRQNIEREPLHAQGFRTILDGLATNDMTEKYIFDISSVGHCRARIFANQTIDSDMIASLFKRLANCSLFEGFTSF